MVTESKLTVKLRLKKKSLNFIDIKNYNLLNLA